MHRALRLAGMTGLHRAVRRAGAGARAGSLLGLLAASVLVLGGCGPHPTPGHPGGTPPPSTTSAAPPSGAPGSAPPVTPVSPPSTLPSTLPSTPISPPSNLGPPVSGALPIPPADQVGPTVTVHGAVQAADTQPGCVVLRTDAGQQFLLVGEALGKLPRTPEGGPAPVLVTGHIGQNQLTHCMLGRPFVADSLRYTP